MKYDLLILVSAIFLTACTESNKAENERGPGLCQNGIINGSEVSEGDPFAKRVGLLQSNETSCTATLIGPNVMLTAAHCVRGKTNLRISFGVSDSCGSPVGSNQVRKIIATRVHENYDDRGFGTQNLNNVKNDIALVKFQGAAPQDMNISRVHDGVSAIETSELIAIGYGDDRENSKARPRLRRVTKDYDDLRSTESSQMLILLQPNSGICTGDSGGPQFVRSQGQYQILAVNSGVMGSNDQDYCRRKAVLMYAPYFSEWISRNLRALR